jgi:regulator of CtrA degradation
MAVNGSPENGSESLNSFTGGKLFDTVFGRGMALVEETASYLDGPGREHARALPREAGLTYSAWSMELTTRLMQAASWLVMQKAEAQRDRGLPLRFLELVARSEALFEQICRLDQALYSAPVPGQAKNAVSDQIAQLQKAAETGAFDPLMVWHRAK